MKIDFETYRIKLLGVTLVLGVAYSAFDGAEIKANTSLQANQISSENDCPAQKEASTFDLFFDVDSPVDKEKTVDVLLTDISSLFKMHLIQSINPEHFITFNNIDFPNTFCLPFQFNSVVKTVTNIHYTANPVLYNFYFTSLSSGNKAGPGLYFI